VGRTNAMIFCAILLFCGYFVWNVFVNDRYQALCNVSYWSASSQQRTACKDMKTELDGR
jgi:hypothetical protein